jgi:hypothetical protein
MKAEEGNNPYRSPEQALQRPAIDGGETANVAEIASARSRLAAAIIDAVLPMVLWFIYSKKMFVASTICLRALASFLLISTMLKGPRGRGRNQPSANGRPHAGGWRCALGVILNAYATPGRRVTRLRQTPNGSRAGGSGSGRPMRRAEPAAA